MKDFLNRYMASNRNLQRESADDLKRTFTTVVNFLDRTIGHAAFRPIRAINAAVIDSVLVGMTRRLASGSITDVDRFKSAYNQLLQNTEYKSAVETGTSQEANVETRMSQATSAFRDVP
jgi:hypothetical protein